MASARTLRSAALAAPSASPELIDELERRACRYFFEMADPQTGLVLDRTDIEGRYSQGIASIAATGFGLSALTIAAGHGYLAAGAARKRLRDTLRFLCEQAQQEHGFFYHFLDSATGRRAWRSEASSVDTAWLLCGALHCRQSWDDKEIQTLASELLNRTDWQWMLNGRTTLSHGWTPERGFLPYSWDRYSELLAMYLLAIGSATHGIPPSCWGAWKRPLRDYGGVFFIDDGSPLFVHQYSHAWFDFRDRTDGFANYFHNSQRATQAHRLYCVELSTKFPWYGPNMWGVTASDSRHGYRVWATPSHPADGTLVPCAAGGSLVFLPNSCGSVLQTMFDLYGGKVWCRYGFVDAFHPQQDWYSRCVLGIDLGIMLLMAENMRNQSVWDAIMSAPETERAMTGAGLRPIAI